MHSHTGERPYKCRVCGQTFSQSVTLFCHIFRHFVHGKVTANRISSVVSSNKVKVKVEDVDVSVASNKIECVTMKLEQRNVDGVGVFVCLSSDKVLSARRECEQQHVTTVHDCVKSFECTDVCGKTSFAESENLAQHIMRTHSGKRLHVCSVCDKAFTAPGHLTSHMRTHTSERPFECQVCGQTFTDSGNLARHMRTHTGERPYECQVCSKAFTESNHLTIHMRTHTGERPYTCQVCGKGFKISSHLTRHMRTHSGDRPYKCSVCGQAFTDSSNLARHMRIHACE
jgi:KRAB domain-containing zinc finger protein